MGFGIGDKFSDNANKDLSGLELEKKEPEVKETVKTETAQEVKEPVKEPENLKSLSDLEIKKEEVKEEVKAAPSEIDGDAVLAYLNKDREKPFESLEEALKPKEVEKIIKEEVNPYEDLMSDDDRAYFKYKRETGRTRKEYDYLNQDFRKIPPIEMAIRRVKSETGIDITDAEAIEYLESKLSIDLDVDELSARDKIELSTYAKPLVDKLEAEKDKYRQPKETVEKKTTDVEMVKLDNGREIPKEEYDELLEKRNKYIENVKEGVNSVTNSVFSIEIDDNGEKRKVEFDYEFSKEDKHSMLSDATDVDATILKRYQTKNGFNHKGLAKDLWWGKEENHNKVILAAMEKARAEVIEEMLASSNNENFKREIAPELSKETNNGYGSLTDRESGNSGFGVKFNGFTQS